jgi:hypothetical protein
VTRLQAGRSGVPISAGATEFSLLQNSRTGCGAHPGLAVSVVIKRPGREADYAPLCSADAKNELRYSFSIPPCRHGGYSNTDKSTVFNEAASSSHYITYCRRVNNEFETI